MKGLYQLWLPMLLVGFATVGASAQAGGSFRVQCPSTTITHPTAMTSEPAYIGPTYTGQNSTPTGNVNGAIKCQQVSAGDGYMTEADGNQTFMFAFGPLSGLGLIQNGLPGTLMPADFNQPYTAGPNFVNGQPNPLYDGTLPNSANAPGANGAITDPAAIMNTGVMDGNIPGPLVAFDEDDEMFLTLTNVGMIMRPDLFEQHTIHFHGYPNASSFYDGVPDASLAVNIGGSFTYYYLAPDAGTYFWHCHITPPEHLQMGMTSQLYVRPRQNRVPVGNSLYASRLLQEQDLRTACSNSGPVDILCSTPLPAANTVPQQVDPFAGVDPRIPAGTPYKYAYNDGDGSTRYDIDVPIQIHGFDPNFHFVGMTFNPEGFADMKDKYFLLNGRSYPDTVGVPGYAGLASSGNPDPVSKAISTEDSDAHSRPSQPLPTLITLSQGERALLRISDLDVYEYQTLASLGLPMQMVGFNAKLLRDQAGNNLFITTNSITLAGGESMDVILDSCAARDASFACINPIAKGTYFLYTPQLDHLSNDAENFGGLMTEVVIQ